MRLIAQRLKAASLCLVALSVACVAEDRSPDPLAPPPLQIETSARASIEDGRCTAPALALGGRHTCLTKSDGRVTCWGNNAYGQLGVETAGNLLSPVVVPDFTGVVALAAGVGHSCALRDDETVWCWGRNNNGQLGDGTLVNHTVPAEVPGLTEITAISAGQYHTCALKRGGSVWCWGNNGSGRLGDGTTTRRLSPVQVSNLTDATALISGGAFNCALTGSAGDAYCWGANSHGQLGDGTRTARRTPVRITGTEPWLSLSAGTSHTCGIRRGLDRQVECWGRNNFGQLGDETTVAYRLTPAPVTYQGGAPLIDGAQMAAGASTNCAVLGDGGVACWGRNNNGQLGEGTITTVHRRYATRITPPSGLAGQVLSVTRGTEHACALNFGGSVYCWGYNGYGQLGDNTRVRKSVPTLIGGQTALTFAPFVSEDNVDPSEGRAVATSIASDGASGLWAAGLDERPNGDDAWVVRSSTDLGATWSTRNTFGYAPGRSMSPPAIARTPAGTLYIAGEVTDSAGLSHWLVRESSDGGDSWLDVDDFLLREGKPAGARSIGVDATGALFVAGFGDDASDVRHWLLRTSVDGREWVTADDFEYPAASSNAAQQAVDAGEDGQWVIGTVATGAGSRMVLRRSDGGWTGFTIADELQYQSSFDTIGVGVSVDAGGRIYTVSRADSTSGLHWVVRRSSDGGATWVTVDDYQRSSGTDSSPLAVAVDRNGSLQVAGIAGSSAPWEPLTAVTAGTGPEVTATAEGIEVLLPSTSVEEPAGTPFSGGAASSCQLRGDFDVFVEFQLGEWPAASGVHVGLVLGGDTSVERTGLGPTCCDLPSFPRELYLTDFAGETGNTPVATIGGVAATNDLGGALRLVRAGSTIVGYVLTGGEWTPLHQHTSASTADVSLAVSAWSTDAAFGDADVRVTFSDLRVRDGELVGAGCAASPRGVLRTSFDHGASWIVTDEWAGEEGALGGGYLAFAQDGQAGLHLAGFSGSSWAVRSRACLCHVAGTCESLATICVGAADGTPCSDGNACTQTDTCQDGVCFGANPISCAAQDDCHLPGLCNPSSGVCSNPVAPDGTSCDDGSLCTPTDTCTSGTCSGAGGGGGCTPSDQCHVAGACNPATGQCTDPAAPNGTPCDDNNPATQDDACTSGLCVGSVTCNPTTEVCNGQDDDCDGATDEGLGTLSCGVGQCARTVAACTSGQANTCTPGNPAAEACDGLDNNCDGSVDEGNPGSGQSCNTGVPGACTTGSTTCTEGALSCTQTVQPTSETCNGVDDDCDGTTDDGAAATCAPIANAVATCQGGECVVGACLGVYDDCDGSAANGCETDISSDAAHCGSCVDTCPIGGCSNGVCGCTPYLCGDLCGSWDNGCGGTLSCGSCREPAIAAGGGFTCALRSNGTIRCWGNNAYGQLGNGSTISAYWPEAVTGLNNVQTLAAGENHACAMLSDGTVWCWGYNGNGQLGDGTTTQRTTPVQVTGITTAQSITAGSRHSCALLADGTARCWGYNAYGQLGDGTTTQRTTSVAVSTLTGVSAIGGGLNHTCAILTSGAMRCWGYNGYGAIGDGTTTQRTTPVAVTGITTALELGIAFNGDYSCVALTDGTARCWGYNGYGQLGDGTTTQRTTAVTVTGVADAVEISAGINHTCVRRSDNTARCWGYNGYGQLGDGTTTQRTTSVAVTGITTAAGIATGSYHSCALLADETVRCWGYNANGELGDETTINRTTSVPVFAFPCGGGGTSNVCGACVPTTCEAQGATEGTISDGCGGTLYCGAATLSTVGSGSYFTCAIEEDTSVSCWGYNTYGQLGNGSTANSYFPVQVTGLTGAVQVSAGESFACALRNDGTIWCWGYNGNGQLGDGTQIQRSTPVLVTGIGTAQSITTGRVHACARLANGQARCWGYNGYGQLGDGTTTQRLTPVAVTSLSGVAEVSAGSNHTCALLSNGLVRCWGYNSNSQLGNGSTQALQPVHVPSVSGAISIAAARTGDFTCALMSDGTGRCWGYNSYGNLGDGTTTLRTTPVTVVGLANAVAITAGDLHTCAELSDGTARCWGYNGTGTIGDGTTTQRNLPTAVTGLSSVLDISAGTRHTCATLTDGTAKCWGYNPYGELGDQTSIDHTSALPVWAFPCGGGGTSNVCTEGCTPTTCLAQGLTQGTIADGCGGTLYCGRGTQTLTAAGSYFSCAIDDDAGVQCWGYNAYGQLGNNTTANSYFPVHVQGVASAAAVVTGDSFACALVTDGTVRCWGYNGNGQLGDGTTTQRSTPVQVTGITNAVNITAGRVHACARLSDGTARCWGYNGYGQLGDGTTTQRTTPVAVSGLSEIADLGAGSNHSCALLTNGQVKCWGNNTSGQIGNGTTQQLLPAYTPGITTGVYLGLARTGDYSCVALSDGTARCWGYNSYGNLGDGTTTQRITPVSVVGLTTATELSAGDLHTCAKLADGTARCWGYNGTGTLGDGTTTQRTSPVVVAGVSGVLTISAGTRHTCARLSDGTERCWGYNPYGELGDQTTIDHTSSAPVWAFPCGGGGTSNVCTEGCTPTTCLAEGEIEGTIADGCGGTLYCGRSTQTLTAAGSYFSCAMTDDATVQCWGYNAYGQLGNGTQITSYFPVPVTGLSGVSAVVTGDSYACALLSDGTVRCWGYNGNGQLGDGTTTQRTTPVQVTGITNAVNITAGRVHACARLADGTARCWGYNAYGQLGDGTTTQRTTPVTVSGLGGVADLGAGSNHTCALLSNGQMKCWGNNTQGQLGNGTTQSLLPVYVPGITTGVYLGIARTGDYSCIALADGTARCWGYNSYGNLGDASTTQRILPATVAGLSTATELSAGDLHTCAKLADGTARCWGYNGTGTLGDGTTTQRTSPVAVTGISGLLTISAGTRHTCARLSDGTERCWGYNPYGELGDQTSIDHNTPAPVWAFPCGGGGTSNNCTEGCTPTTCNAQGEYEGSIADGCGGSLRCGRGFDTELAAGNYFSCALTDGEVQCWGYNAYGQLGNGTTVTSYVPVTVTGLSGATSLVTGENYACALLGDGTIRCWGYNGNGQLGDGTTTQRTTPVQVAGITSAVTITGGRVHTCARLSDGTARCWGYNAYGQLGDGTTTQRTTPVAVSGLTDVADIGAGSNHSCAVLSNGRVKCWGYNATGQLGNGVTQQLTPANVPNIDTAVSVGLPRSGDFSCAALSDGTARCWGSNTYGQLGDGTTTQRTTPVTVSGLSSAVELAAGDIHMCAKLSDGSARCWGYNGQGALGDGTTTNRTTPVAVSGLTTVVTIATGYRHTCAKLLDGTVRCWGYNPYGELGDETSIDHTTPQPVFAYPCGGGGTSNVCTEGCTPTTCALQGATAGTIADGCGGTLFCGSGDQSTAANGNYFTCGLESDGTAQCWGYNAYGQLGNGTTNTSYSPVAVTGLTNAISVSAGTNHACALINDGTIRCWGLNTNGQLGDGSTTTRTTPVSVTGITTAVEISAGRLHTCARLADGSARCWGYNNYGQLGDGTTTQRTTPVAVSTMTDAAAIGAGGNHSCALRTNGLVRCWGYNANGQLGNGTTQQLTPANVPGVTNTVALGVARLGDYSCAVASDGTARCWGSNTYGNLGDGTTTQRTTSVAVTGLSSAVAISAGDIHTCARLSDGTARCWGYNGQGQLGDGTTTQRTTSVAVTGLANIDTISAGYRHTCAQLGDGTMSCWGNNPYGELGDQTSIDHTLAAAVYAFPCGGGGTSNVCDAFCTPTTCAAQGATSGTISDGCGGTLFCGATEAPVAASGQNFTCGLRSDGTVRCWGYNGQGQLGNGTTTNSNTPVTPIGVTGALSIVAGDDHACALVSGGTIRCWGLNTNGQLGDGTTTNRTTPITVSGITTAVEVIAGRVHTCARLSDGTARCWGYNAYGQLGDNTATQRTTPVTVLGMSDAAQLGAGANHTCALRTNGLVRCWGYNASGQLGNGTTQQLIPANVPNVTGAIGLGLARSGDHSCAVSSDGSVRCWGSNTYGSLGDGTTTQRTTPVAVSGISSAVQVTAGDIHSCARLADASVRCWGYNAQGQLGDGTTTQRTTPVTINYGASTAAWVSAGYRHNCIQMTDGAMVCSGDNPYGELGDQTTTDRTTPVAVLSYP